VVLKGGDVLGLAETGTGKTAAFMLPVLDQIVRNPRARGVRVLVLEPTRELAEQVHQATAVLGRNSNVRSAAIYGGVSKIPQLADFRRGVEIVVACPGRLLDHVEQGDVDLSKIEVLVLDEADTMLDMGFLPDVRRIIGHLPQRRQSLLFSATMPEEIRKLAVRVLNDPTIVQVGRIGPAQTVSHALYPVPDNRKKLLLAALLAQTPTGRALVFTRTKFRARNLARDLVNLNFRVSALQGNLSQSRRQQAMDGFRTGKFDILVATDIAAHGIDVPEVSHVINFDMPDTVDAYIHRIGRTGRALQEGEAFTLATSADAPMVRQVEKVLNAPVEIRSLPGFDYGDFSPEKQFSQAPRSGSNGQPRTGPARQPRVGADSRPSSGTDRQPGTGPAKQPRSGSDSRPRTSPARQSRPGSDRQPRVGSDSQPRTGPARQPRVGSDSQPRTGPARQPRVGSDSQPRTGPARQPRVGSDSRPSSGPDRQPRTGPDRQPRTGSDRQPRSGSPVQPRSGPSRQGWPSAGRRNSGNQSNGGGPGGAKRRTSGHPRAARGGDSPPSHPRPPGRG
jgi:ATP-dependent RNA helicase RhlE